jgi:hypothetical protein
MKRIGAALGLLCVAVMAAGCTSVDTIEDAGEPPAQASPTQASTATPSPSTSPSATPSVSLPTPKVVTYETDDESGVTVAEPGQKTKIGDASASFSTFLDRQLARAIKNRDSICPEPPQIYVNKVAPDGWASGGYFVPQCGGYAALWAISDGAWREVWTGQELVDCLTLERYQFPAEIAGTTCMDGETSVGYPRGA